MPAIGRCLAAARAVVGFLNPWARSD